jgi:hypothetical protein
MLFSLIFSPFFLLAAQLNWSAPLILRTQGPSVLLPAQRLRALTNISI